MKKLSLSSLPTLTPLRADANPTPLRVPVPIAARIGSQRCIARTLPTNDGVATAVRRWAAPAQQ